MRILTLVAVAGSSGCLFTDATVPLSPAPTTSVTSRERGAVALAPVIDRTRTPGRIGIKKSGMGSKSADVRPAQSVATWFGRRLHNELARAGLTVLDTDPEVPQITVSVLDFFAEPDVGMVFELHALVHAEVVVQLPDGRQYARRFAQRRRSTEMTLTDGDYQDRFDEVVRAWMDEAVPAILSLIEDGNTGVVTSEAWRWLG